MSKRRKKPYTEIKKQRAATGFQFDRHVAPSPQAVASYEDTLARVEDDPSSFVDLMQADTNTLHAWATGIAFRDRLNLPADEVHSAAQSIKDWHIIGGYKYFYDWWPPIAGMSIQQIIAQCDTDRADGKLRLDQG